MGKYFKRLLMLSALLCWAGLAWGQDGDRHLVRLGWGDMLFESMAFHPGSTTSDYTYSGHFFADYHFSLTRLISVGGQVDIQSINWTENKQFRSRNYDLCVIPTVRFTWLHREWVRLYSGLGFGFLFAFDNAGGKGSAPVLNLNPIGIQVGNSHWCGSLDLGFMASASDLNQVYLMGARLISVGVNYRW